MAIDTPNWIKSSVIYEAFPRNHSKSGTFAGLCHDLERISRLHADVLWLMPIHPIGAANRKGSLGSPYAIRDYRAINPDLGDEQSFRELINKAHALGMKVIIDVVFNHTSRDSVLLAQHPEWFLQDDHGNPATKVPDWWDVYDLDYSQQGLWDYQIETLRKWVQMGVDGFRCDVASLVPLDFWLTARKELSRGRKENLIWLAESVDKSFIKILRDTGWTAHSDPELHAAFDLTYDYDGFDYLKGYIQGQCRLDAYLNHLYIQETLYPAHAVKMRFIENHDNPRAAEMIRDKGSLMNWTVFYTLLPGATLVYAGQEIASAHYPDLFGADPIDWTNGDYEFTAFMENALELSKKIKGTCTHFSVSQLVDGVVKIVWRGSGSSYVALINLAGKYGEVCLDELKECHAEVCLGRREKAQEHGRCRLANTPLVVRTPA